MEAALPLEATEYDPSVEETGDVSEMTAEQYLSWVRHQASQIPDIRRAEIDPSLKNINRQSKYMPQLENILSCPEAYLPSEEWQHQMLYSFSELRTNLYRMSLDDSSKERKVEVPTMKDISGWHRFCLADEIDGETGEDSSSWEGTVGQQAEISSRNTDIPTGRESRATHRASLSVVQDNGTIEEDAMETCIQNSSVETHSERNSVQPQAQPSAQHGGAATTGGMAAVSKRKRDLAYQLGVSLTREPANSGEEGSNVAAGMSSERGDAQEEQEEEEDENAAGMEEAIKEVWSNAAKSLQWTGAINVDPSNTMLLQFDQVLTQRVLIMHIDWLEVRMLTPKRARWIYGLLARVEKPLHREVISSIRQLYRRCCFLRHHLKNPSGDSTGTHQENLPVTVDSGGGGEPTGTGSTCSKETFEADLAALNLVIAICGSYFGQGEEYDGTQLNKLAEMEQEEEEEEEEEEEKENWEEEMEYMDDDQEEVEAEDKGDQSAWTMRTSIMVNPQLPVEPPALEDGEEPESSASAIPSNPLTKKPRSS